MMFSVLVQCKSLVALCLPSMTLRHGTIEDWAMLFPPSERTIESPPISSLEIRAMSLTQGELGRAKCEDVKDKRALESGNVDFSRLRRLKIVGRSNFMGITHRDLISIARTATGLRELHIFKTSSEITKGIEALVESSMKTLEVFELEPHYAALPAATATECTVEDRDLNSIMVQCIHLHAIAIDCLHSCVDLLRRRVTKWNGPMKIHSQNILFGEFHQEHVNNVWHILDSARELMASSPNTQLTIEIALPRWVFEPQNRLVHGTFNDNTRMNNRWQNMDVKTKPSRRLVRHPNGDEMRDPVCMSEDNFKAAIATKALSFYDYE